jgi:hypothetical protein
LLDRLDQIGDAFDADLELIQQFACGEALYDPITLPGRREEIRAPRVANVGGIIVNGASKSGISGRFTGPRTREPATSETVAAHSTQAKR